MGGSAVIAAVFLAGGVFVRNTWFPPYVGTTRPATVLYSCRNAIFLPFTTNGRRWWAGSDPRPRGIIRTVPVTVPMPGPDGESRRAAGRVTFTSATHAIFTSAAGGRLGFELQAHNASYFQDCGAIALDDPSF